MIPAFTELHEKSRTAFNESWAERNTHRMQASLDRANPGLRAEFERKAGVKLPRTQCGTDETIEKYFNQENGT